MLEALDTNYKALIMINGCGASVLTEEDENHYRDESEDTYNIMFECFEFDTVNYPCSIYPFFRWTDSGEPYVNVYLWGRHEDSSVGVKRYVIAENKKFPSEIEEDYLTILRNPYQVSTDREIFNEFADKLQKHIPALKAVSLDSRDVSRVMLEIYFLFMKTGPLEILIKSGLRNIAFNLAEISNANLMGSNPAEIIGLPLKLLRILDQKELVDQLFTERKIARCKRVYDAYSALIAGSKDKYHTYPSRCQFMYLWRTLTPNGPRFNKSIYRELCYVKEIRYIRDYERFLRLQNTIESKLAGVVDADLIKEALGYQYEKKIPNRHYVTFAIDNLEYVIEDIDAALEFQKCLDELKVSKELHYSNDDFSASTPESIREIFLEGKEMNNCIGHFWTTVARKKGNIVFVRKRNSNSSLIDIEINPKGVIEQAYRPDNAIPAIAELEFIEEYANIKGLRFNPREIYKPSKYAEDKALAHFIENHFPEPDPKYCLYEDFFDDDFDDVFYPVDGPGGEFYDEMFN
ncbi:MAG: PcfJ domain-containing protein [Lachnospiraceae bacterium]|nr:PcfJ domain-containing protein [Lachnospiraceae bacterium]